MELHDLYFEIIWKEIKRTRMRALFDEKIRNRKRIAVILTFAGEKVLKAVWNSSFSVNRRLIRNDK